MDCAQELMRARSIFEMWVPFLFQFISVDDPPFKSVMWFYTIITLTVDGD